MITIIMLLRAHTSAASFGANALATCNVPPSRVSLCDRLRVCIDGEVVICQHSLILARLQVHLSLNGKIFASGHFLVGDTSAQLTSDATFYF